ncbi:hypothetical protein B7P43_G04518 [Cryptotermes secundus]|uniref:Uncharacterized protein n=1 Tax=Cryptotermes secundus TaxID=105785 RepID=A0A2J7RHM7_9NEOP|nr:hypothetical protein B7P43_G04518 [Cryptotermes secundus]
MGFTWINDSKCPIPLCLICGKQLTNAVMAPAKLKRNLTTDHCHMTNKSDGYLNLLESQNKESKPFVSKVAVKRLAAEVTAQKMKSHTVDENLIMTACKISTINRRTDDMSRDALTDFTNYSYALEFVRIVNDGEIQEKFQEREILTSQHFFFHREVLVSKLLVKFIKQRTVHYRMFKKLCEYLDKEHVQLSLLLHTEIRWFIRGRSLNRMFELKAELQVYFQENSRLNFAKCSEREEGLEKLSYLVDIFHHMNQLNKSLQGHGENVVTSSEKILGFKWKLNLWKNHIVKGNLEMFPLLLGLKSEEGYHQVSSLIDPI